MTNSTSRIAQEASRLQPGFGLIGGLPPLAGSGGGQALAGLSTPLIKATPGPWQAYPAYPAVNQTASQWGATNVPQAAVGSYAAFLSHLQNQQSAQQILGGAQRVQGQQRSAAQAALNADRRDIHRAAAVTGSKREPNEDPNAASPAPSTTESQGAPPAATAPTNMSAAANANANVNANPPPADAAAATNASPSPAPSTAGEANAPAPATPAETQPPTEPKKEEASPAAAAAAEAASQPVSEAPTTGPPAAGGGGGEPPPPGDRTCLDRNSTACEADGVCFWDSGYGKCFYKCNLMNSQSTCDPLIECRWLAPEARRPGEPQCAQECFSYRFPPYEDGFVKKFKTEMLEQDKAQKRVEDTLNKAIEANKSDKPSLATKMWQLLFGDPKKKQEDADKQDNKDKDKGKEKGQETKGPAPPSFVETSAATEVMSGTGTGSLVDLHMAGLLGTSLSLEMSMTDSVLRNRLADLMESEDMTRDLPPPPLPWLGKYRMCGYCMNKQACDEMEYTFKQRAVAVGRSDPLENFHCHWGQVGDAYEACVDLSDNFKNQYEVSQAVSEALARGAGVSSDETSGEQCPGQCYSPNIDPAAGKAVDVPRNAVHEPMEKPCYAVGEKVKAVCNAKYKPTNAEATCVHIRQDAPPNDATETDDKGSPKPRRELRPRFPGERDPSWDVGVDCIESAGVRLCMSKGWALVTVGGVVLATGLFFL
ncbi:unnamed protein product [Vitrella brassicaformis CCMP3155]|uniref:Uncharacterized protein n=1 Tax=Vitrella brassicaformis (strain CCMP3155) TaxID=1169540 RepID=A0A0G4EPB9_VITBC|nr:unnamed protein product [Vitrella brassicaformis CCMP3155]|eukprot:CEL99274.1 unnamed protein product [Vitrella brassicaformis CCMP3155]